MTTALVTNDDLLRVLAGRTLAVTTDDGKSVHLRMMTTDELLETNRRFTEGTDTPPMPYAMAAQLTRQVDLFTLLDKS